MTLTPEEISELTRDEENRWQKTYRAIVAEVHQTKTDFERDRKLARELTSQIVATRRDEEKMALASDEAVAHGLSSLRKDKSSDLASLLEEPYFARVVTEEDERSVEFRLGTASFPAERIIDWRKAPISKLYYDYKEGDDFSEVIQGNDRNGIIKLRRGYKGHESELHRIETAKGVFLHTPQGWELKKDENLSRSDDDDGHLPQILSLITPEQFALITRDTHKPVVIQGIAGSGKTTVALHRLAWLLHEDNSDCRADRSLVVMFNRSLKAYVENTLPKLKIFGVPIRTYTQWANQLLNEILGSRPRGNFSSSREVEIFKSSGLCLKKLHEFVSERESKGQFVQDLFDFFQFLTKQDLIWPFWDRIKNQIKQQIALKQCDLQDDSILLHLIYAHHGYYPTKSPHSLGSCDHLVIDEAQDFGVVEIRALLNAVDPDKTVTIVGDIGQKIVMGRDFGGWNQLLTEAGFTDTTPISLTVSYRSTNEIMEIAKKIRGNFGDPTAEQTVHSSDGHGGRHGPGARYLTVEGPKFIAYRIGQWIGEIQKSSPKALSAIICRWPKVAQELVDELRKIGYSSVRLGHRDQFDFSPGVVVTNVHQVKGLEFRNVLIVDPSEDNYKSTSDEEQNLLYVAVTRAERSLDFIGYKKKSGLLPMELLTIT